MSVLNCYDMRYMHAMHGTGNNFIIIDSRSKNLDYKKIANKLLSKPIYDQKFLGEVQASTAEYSNVFEEPSSASTTKLPLEIEFRKKFNENGCDQVIIITHSSLADCFMHVYNADGSKAEMCGNAARCVGYLIMLEKSAEYITIELVNKRILECFKVGDKSIKVNMGKPLLKWHEIPLSIECDTLHVPLEFEMLRDPVAVNIGNPHIIFFSEDKDKIPLQQLGPKLENHNLFPKKTNVSVAQIRPLSKPIYGEKFLGEAQASTAEYSNVFEERSSASTTKLPLEIELQKRSIEKSGEISLRVWERGTGITASCGSAACAALIASVLRGYLSSKKASVNLPGGTLLIEWANDVFMTGDVGFLYRKSFYQKGHGHKIKDIVGIGISKLCRLVFNIAQKFIIEY